MRKRSFSSIVPSEYDVLPTNLKTNNDFGMAVGNICDHLEMTIPYHDGSTTDTAFIADAMDQYAKTPEGKLDFEAISNITNRLGSNLSEAFRILKEDVAGEVTKLTKSIDDETSRVLSSMIPESTEGTNVAKMYLLDVVELYNKYNSTSKEFVKYLCSTYNYQVEYLNDANILGLIKRTQPTGDISISTDTLKKVLEDVTVTITSTGNDDVVIDTSDPNAVKVEGAPSNTTIEDDQASTSVEDEEGTSDDNVQVDPDVDVSVKTDNDSNSNINISVNGEQASVDSNSEELTEEESTLLKQILLACFNKNAFEVLRSRLFAPKGHVTHRNITDTLFFVRKPISELVFSAIEPHMSSADLEKLKLNLRAIHELQMCGVIYLDISAVQFSNTIIIGPNLLNKSLVDQAKRDGLDVITMVRDHMRVYHNSNTNDILYDQMRHDDVMQGVSYSTLLSKTYEVQNKIISAKDNAKNRYATAMQDARVIAYRKVVTDYVKTMSENNNEETLRVEPNNKEEFLNAGSRFVISSSLKLANSTSTNVEDLLYSFILDRWYGGTLVHDVHRYMTMYLREMSSSNQMDEKSFSMVKARIISEVGSRFLFKHFV